MPSTLFTWPALAGCLFLICSSVATAQRPADPVWVEPDARALATSPTVARKADALLESTLSGTRAGALIAEITAIHDDTSLLPAERDAVLFGYIERLREFSPGAAPETLLDWLSEVPPLAVTAHEEGAHHPVALFDVAAAARGLANEWAWRRGYQAVAGADPLSASILARQLGELPGDSPRLRGMRQAIDRLPAERLNAIAMQCAVESAGCGEARPDIELARGNVEWLAAWSATSASRELLPRLRNARQHLTRSEALELLHTVVQHPDKGVAAWAMNEISVRVSGDPSAHRNWGGQLIKLLADPDLGAAAALQLARMDKEDWLEAAAAQPMDETARRRLELLVELESDLPEQSATIEAGP